MKEPVGGWTRYDGDIISLGASKANSRVGCNDGEIFEASDKLGCYNIDSARDSFRILNRVKHEPTRTVRYSVLN